MSYYIMFPELDSDNDLVIEGKSEFMSMNPRLTFRIGKLVYQPIPELHHDFEADANVEINEVLISPTFKGPLVSKYVKDAIEKLEIENVQFFPITLNHKTLGTTLDAYYIMNIIGSFDPIDYEKSNIRFDGPPEDKDIIDIKSLTFIPMDDLRLPKIFRLKPYLPLLVTHQEVKDSFESLGITGVKFYKPEEYSL